MIGLGLSIPQVASRGGTPPALYSLTFTTGGVEYTATFTSAAVDYTATAEIRIR